MSGFFTLGGKEQEPDQKTTTYNNNSLYLFRNEEIYNKGFELWQQYYQLHHQQQKIQLEDHHVDLSPVGGSSSRRLITTNYINVSTTTTDDDDDQSILLYNNNNRSPPLGFGLMSQSGAGGVGGKNNMRIISSSSVSMNCQDCGNQAKKDCENMRCRTCCKSRGFQCQTHVKSTWVPAAKRRERQQHLHLITSSNSPSQQNQQQLSLNPKRERDNSNPLASTPLPTYTSVSAGLEMGQFPAEVSSSAVFRCVNVRAMDDADEQYAYQTAVNIGGHVFKGLLYDQGPKSCYGGGVRETSGGGSGEAQQPLNLIIATTNASTTATTSNPPGVTWLDSSSYPAPLNAFMAGTQFFPPPRP